MLIQKSERPKKNNLQDMNVCVLVGRDTMPFRCYVWIHYAGCWAFCIDIFGTYMPNDTNMNASPTAIQSPIVAIIIGFVITVCRQAKKRTCKKPSNIEKWQHNCRSFAIMPFVPLWSSHFTNINPQTICSRLPKYSIHIWTSWNRTFSCHITKIYYVTISQFDFLLYVCRCSFSRPMFFFLVLFQLPLAALFSSTF